MCSLLTRGLFLRHDIIACFTLHVLLALHNVVNIARFPVVEIDPIIALLGGSLVRADQLPISEDPLNRISSHLFPSEVISELVVHRHRSNALHV